MGDRRGKDVVREFKNNGLKGDKYIKKVQKGKYRDGKIRRKDG